MTFTSILDIVLKSCLDDSWAEGCKTVMKSIHKYLDRGNRVSLLLIFKLALESMDYLYKNCVE